MILPKNGWIGGPRRWIWPDRSIGRRAIEQSSAGGRINPRRKATRAAWPSFIDTLLLATQKNLLELPLAEKPYCFGGVVVAGLVAAGFVPVVDAGLAGLVPAAGAGTPDCLL